MHVFDGKALRVGRSSDVLLQAGRIARVSAPGERLVASPDALLVDGRGRVLMPGLIDTHVHLAIPLPPPLLATADAGYVYALALENARRMLWRGFTSVRDMGGPTLGLQRAIDEGIAVGPRIHSSGAALTQSGGHGDFRSVLEPPAALGGNPHVLERGGWSIAVDGVPAVLAAAREQLRRGASQVKVMAGGGVGSPADPLDSLQFRADELRAAVDAASDWGTYVAAHVYTPAGVRRALEAGVRSIEHGHLIDEPTMRLLVEKNAFLSTQASPFAAGRAPFAATMRAKWEQARAGADTMFRLAKRYGTRLTFSTDLAGPLDYQARQNQEFALRLQWFEPVEILRQATSVGGELLAASGARNPHPGRVGVIEEGALADVLLIEGDPVADLALLAEPQRGIAMIVKGGRVVPRTAP